MDLKEYGLEILLSTLGIPDFYRPYIQGQDANLELIAKYLKGDLLGETDRNPLTPNVNILIDEIENALFENLPSNLPYVQKWYWPNWKEYALCMSHDVDKLSESRKHIWKIRNRFSKMTVLKALLGISNPYNNMKSFIKLEKQYGVQSSFYFLVNEYNFEKISQELQLLKENNIELGLHGMFGTHTNYTKLNEEKEKIEQILGQTVYGTRQHFMKFEFPTTWNIHNQTKLLYDTTVGFNDKIGFKLGFAFPFFSPDPELNPLPLIELPLIIMDAAIWTWLTLTEESALQTIQEIRDIVKRFHGLLTILWHQCTLKMRGGRIYEDILKALVKDSVYVASGVEIAKWWHARNDLQILITQNGNENTIQ
ncbi:MAG: hypothetical protein HWN66_16920, partial [Candidatus Helarchaeota archaeon]|nr:hypothetical protein [Candidatus Helarchaeota archaeon]